MALAAGCPFVRYSPALLILVFPLAFRFTCYYYRGAYYKAFWADPPACAVGEPRDDYRGEAKFPLHPPERPPLLPVPRAALHRPPVASTSCKGFWFTDPATGHAKFGIGVGSLVLLVNVVLLGGYTLRLPLVPPPRRRRAWTAVARRRRARRPTTA